MDCCTGLADYVGTASWCMTEDAIVANLHFMDVNSFLFSLSGLLLDFSALTKDDTLLLVPAP